MTWTILMMDLLVALALATVLAALGAGLGVIVRRRFGPVTPPASLGTRRSWACPRQHEWAIDRVRPICRTCGRRMRETVLLAWRPPWKCHDFPCRICGDPCTKRGGRCATCAARETAEHRKPRRPSGPRTRPLWGETPRPVEEEQT